MGLWSGHVKTLAGEKPGDWRTFDFWLSKFAITDGWQRLIEWAEVVLYCGDEESLKVGKGAILASDN